MIKKIRSRKDRGLSKYDAPLIIQYTKGVNAFKRNEKSPYHLNSMAYREWQRGWNDAYARQYKRIQVNETRRRGKEVYAK